MARVLIRPHVVELCMNLNRRMIRQQMQSASRCTQHHDVLCHGVTLENTLLPGEGGLDTLHVVALGAGN